MPSKTFCPEFFIAFASQSCMNVSRSGTRSGSKSLFSPAPFTRILAPEMQENGPNDLGWIDGAGAVREQVGDRLGDLDGGRRHHAQGLQPGKDVAVLIDLRR